MMRVLIDTNIFVYREGHAIVPDSLQQLEKKLRQNKADVLIHPESLKEVRAYPDMQRRDVLVSKISSYLQLEAPEYAPGKDAFFDSKAGMPKNENGWTDNSLLFAVHKNAIDCLVSNDKELIKKGVNLGLAERVLSIDDAFDLFQKLYPEPKKPSAPPSLGEFPVSSLDINDSILNTLRSEYYDFDKWFMGISTKGRKAWVYRNEDGTIGAIMVYNPEEDPIVMQAQTVPPKKRLKICLLKSEARGQKLGELFLKIAFDYARKNGIADVYLTHFTKEDDSLVALIENYGFYRIGKTKKYGDDVFYKRFYAEGSELQEQEPVQLDRLLYPALYDGEKVNKFLVPVQPQFHQRLFIEQTRTPRLGEFSGEMVVEGNAITKAYLSNAKIGKIKAGDVVLFYQSGQSGITCAGTAERVFQKQTDALQIQRLVGRRTVYSLEEIQKMASKDTLIILFRWHFNLKKPVGYKSLIQTGVLSGPPQSILQLDEPQYQSIKKLGEVDSSLALG